MRDGLLEAQAVSGLEIVEPLIHRGAEPRYPLLAESAAVANRAKKAIIKFFRTFQGNSLTLGAGTRPASRFRGFAIHSILHLRVTDSWTEYEGDQGQPKEPPTTPGHPTSAGKPARQSSSPSTGQGTGRAPQAVPPFTKALAWNLLLFAGILLAIILVFYLLLWR
jgi:hypothetical protein